jgi:predicted transcriptional regulator
MKLQAIQELLKAKILTGAELLGQVDVSMICGSDLISDVLSFTKEKSLLLTGLTNPQIIRTAEMIDLCGIIFVRGKIPGEDVITMATELFLPLLVTDFPLYESCGILYAAGLKGCSGLQFNYRG